MTVTQYRLHSHFNLVKRNGIVQLIIDKWDGEVWLAGRDGWQTIFQIPEGFRPAVPVAENVHHIYCPNLFGFHLRVRINIDKNAVEIFSDHVDSQLFYGTVTWVTDE